MDNYSDVFNKPVCSFQKISVIFQPDGPFLLRNNKQGGHRYLVPCSLIRDSRVISSDDAIQKILSNAMKY